MYNFIPRTGMRRARATSPLFPIRNSQSITHLHKNAAENTERSTALTRQVSQLSQLSNPVYGTTSGLGPFSIYNLPRYYRKFYNDDDWRRLKVRGGGIISQDDTDSITLYATSVGGTDTVHYIIDEYDSSSEAFLKDQTPPPDNTQIGANWNEIVVPDDSDFYYFWVSLTQPSGETFWPQLFFGKETATATAMYSGNTVSVNWPNFPNEDPYNFIIGSAQCSGRVLTFSQWRRDHIRISGALFSYASGGGHPTLNRIPMRFAGEYSASAYYYYGDVVTKDADDVRTQYCYYPPNSTTAYPIYDGPITNIDPASNTPDPWCIISVSPLNGSWVTGAYDASKAYFRQS